MEYLILGMLMANKLTAYEIQQAIKIGYQDICSHSIGNVQRALKLMLGKNFVLVHEKMTGKVVKKVYEITPNGRTHFMQWMHQPLELTKAKNMELGKLLLLGFLPLEKRLDLIKGQIEALKADLAYLREAEAITNEQGVSDETTTTLHEYIQENELYINELLASTNTTNIFDLKRDIEKYAMLTLYYGIENIQFNIVWFEKMYKEMQSKA